MYSRHIRYSFLLADVEFVSEVDFKKVKVDEYVPISTVINSNAVCEPRWMKWCVKEKMPQLLGR